MLRVCIIYTCDQAAWELVNYIKLINVSEFSVLKLGKTGISKNLLDIGQNYKLFSQNKLYMVLKYR